MRRWTNRTGPGRCGSAGCAEAIAGTGAAACWGELGRGGDAGRCGERGRSGDRPRGIFSGVGMRLKLKTLELEVPGRAEDGLLTSMIENAELRPSASAR